MNYPIKCDTVILVPVCVIMPYVIFGAGKLTRSFQLTSHTHKNNVFHTVAV